jgi:hypothetical protein
MEEDDDGLRCRARIIGILDDHDEKNIPNKPELKEVQVPRR